MSHEFWVKFDVSLPVDRDTASVWIVEFLRALPGPVDYELVDDPCEQEREALINAIGRHMYEAAMEEIHASVDEEGEP